MNEDDIHSKVLTVNYTWLQYNIPGELFVNRNVSNVPLNPSQESRLDVVPIQNCKD